MRRSIAESVVPPDVLEREAEADALWSSIDLSTPDSEGFVSFSDVAMYLLGSTAQFASWYVDPDWVGDSGQKAPPYLGKGLRIVGDPKRYHGLKIHADDVEEFVDRYRQHQHEQFNQARRKS